MRKISVKLVEQIIDIWENFTDVNQYRDVLPQSEIKKIYKKVAEKINKNGN